MKLTRDEHLYFNACAKALLACPEVQSMSAFTQHGRVSCLEHSLSVAYYSYWLCRRLRLRVDGESLIRGALLHDFFLYDWHTVGRQYGLHGFTHPATALKNARQRFRLSHKAENVIASHMWPLTLRRLPRCKEAAAGDFMLIVQRKQFGNRQISGAVTGAVVTGSAGQAAFARFFI